MYIQLCAERIGIPHLVKIDKNGNLTWCHSQRPKTKTTWPKWLFFVLFSIGKDTVIILLLYFGKWPVPFFLGQPVQGVSKWMVQLENIFFRYEGNLKTCIFGVILKTNNQASGLILFQFNWMYQSWDMVICLQTCQVHFVPIYELCIKRLTNMQLVLEQKCSR